MGPMKLTALQLASLTSTHTASSSKIVSEALHRAHIELAKTTATIMPFGQLVLGSPGAGKTTFCDGSEFTLCSDPYSSHV